MGYMWNMFHCYVTMRVLSRLHTIPCIILELSILKFVTIWFVIMLLKVTLTKSMFVSTRKWWIFCWEDIMLLDKWTKRHWCFQCELETHLDACKGMSLLTNPWYISYDNYLTSWILFSLVLHLNPCRYLDKYSLLVVSIMRLLTKNACWWRRR